MKKKMLIVSQYFYPEIGSAGNRIKNIYQLLRDEHYEVTVLTTNPNYPNHKLFEDREFWDDRELNEDTQIHRLPLKNRKYSRNIFSRLLAYLEVALKMLIFIFRNKKKFDVVFATSPPIFVGMVGVIAKWRFRALLYLDIRDLWPESLKGVGVFNYRPVLYLLELCEKFMYKKADLIIVNSRGFINFIHKRSKLSKDKIYYLPNASRDFEVSQPPTKKHSRRAIYAGNLGLAQDVEGIGALAEALSSKNIGLDVMGYGIRSGELKSFVEERNLTNVRFISPKTRDQCLEEIKKYAVAVATLTDKSVFETVLPGKIIDYMSCAVPIVAAVSGHAKNTVLNEKVGFVSETHNIDEMTTYIEKIINSPQLSEEMSNNSKRCIWREFLWESNISKFISHAKYLEAGKILKDKSRVHSL